MILPIDNRYRIAAGRYGWAIQRARKRKGHVVWEAIMWFPRLEAAVNELGNLMVRTSNAKSLAEALAVAENATATIIHALSPRFELNLRLQQEKSQHVEAATPGSKYQKTGSLGG